MSNETVRRTLIEKVLSVMCASVLCAILVAGLWPFNLHLQNEVSWLRNETGVRFGRRGIIFSSGAFERMSSRKEASCSLEIWLQPASDNGAKTILAFSTPDSPEQFRLRQYIDGLLVQREIRDQGVHPRTAKIDVDHFFRREKQAFITITSGAQGTAIYKDGALVKMAPHFGLASKDFSGQLVLGTSPVAYDTWSGQLRGVAIYSQELTAAQVLRHYDIWIGNNQLELVKNEGAVAFYRFAEQAGRVIHNQVSTRPDLYIPETFEIPHKAFLEPPWKEFHHEWTYFKDVVVNVAGFIPFGFLFCAYFSLAGHSNRAAFVTVILGGTVSFAIEILQAYLPTRTSGLTDIITNTFGTGIGVILYRCKTAQALLAKVGNRSYGR